MAGMNVLPGTVGSPQLTAPGPQRGRRFLLSVEAFPASGLRERIRRGGALGASPRRHSVLSPSDLISAGSGSASASLDQLGRPAGAAADLSEDSPALELGVAPR